MEDPILPIPNNENADPNRPKFRKDTAEPTFTKSSTDNELPKRPAPYIENEDPIRPKLRTDSADPK